MNFVLWLVFGILLMLIEMATGTLHLLAIGLAFIYPAIASYTGASTYIQLAALGSGTLVHLLIVFILRKLRPSSPSSKVPTDVGQRVEVIEWLDEGAARVMYHGKEWPADKAEIEMPDADHGIIKIVQYGRLIIATGPVPPENT